MKIKFFNRKGKKTILTVDRIYEDGIFLVASIGRCDCYKNSCDCVKSIRIPSGKVLEVIEGDVH